MRASRRGSLSRMRTAAAAGCGACSRRRPCGHRAGAGGGGPALLVRLGYSAPVSTGGTAYNATGNETAVSDGETHRATGGWLGFSRWRRGAGGGDAGGAGAAAANASEANATAAANETHAVRTQPHGSRWGWRDCAVGSGAVTPLSHCWMYEGLAVPLTKSELRRSVAEGRCSVFHEAQVRLGESALWLQVNLHTHDACPHA